ADLVLALGNSLNAVSTTRWRRQLPEVIQVDIDPTMIGRYYSQVTTGVPGDLASFATAVVTAAGSRAEAARASRSDWLAGLQDAEGQWWALSDPAEAPAGQPVSPAHLVRALREVSPNDTLLIPDAGNPGVWSFLWQIRQPNSYIKPVGFVNMGFALPSAMASV